MSRGWSTARRAVLLVTLGAVASACASLGWVRFRDPVVTFRDARITGLGVSGGAVEIVLDVQNPNGFRLQGTRLSYTVFVDSTALGSGALTDGFAVDKGAHGEVRLPLEFTYRGIGAAGRALLMTGTVQYRVRGEFTVATPLGSFTRPYDQRGRFSSVRGNARD